MKHKSSLYAPSDSVCYLLMEVFRFRCGVVLFGMTAGSAMGESPRICDAGDSIAKYPTVPVVGVSRGNLTVNASSTAALQCKRVLCGFD